jgi:diguanylate cyclase (GGDEF)-like protein
MSRLEHLFRRARRSSGALYFAVLYLDLDRFKNVNDTLGHQAGDELLVEITRRLERCVRPSDTLARFGGDEFAVLLEDIASSADATAVAERIHDELTAPIVVHGHEVRSSVSLGIALASAGYERPEDMLRDADTAMYRAKADGRARHQVAGGAAVDITPSIRDVKGAL